MGEIGLFEAIYTLRAMRRLKPDPVPQELVEKVLDAAIRAPSTRNLQPWRFIVIRDPALKEAIARYYRDAWEKAFGSRTPADAEEARLIRSGTYLAQHLAQVPVLILVCLEGDRVRQGRARLSLYASVFPAVQNLLLAARGLGLGTTLTTIWRAHEEEIKGLLGIPRDVEAVALIPLGYPQEPFRPNRRRPLAEVTYYERWGRREP